MAMTSKLIMCKGHKSPILNCAGLKEYNEKTGQFYLSRSPFAYFPEEINGKGKQLIGLIPYCKECVQKIFEYYYDNGKNQFNTAVYYTCQKLDIPFIGELFEEIFKQYKENKVEAEFNDIKFSDLGKKYMSIYISKLNKASVRYKDKVDFTCSECDFSQIDTTLEKRELAKKELERFQLDWGIQDSDEDYALLEYKYNLYTEGKTLTTAQDSLYRQLCLVELSKRRKENTKESTKEEQDMMIKLMDKLKISNFDEQKEKSDIDRILEHQIWEIENTEPSELVNKKEYEDYLDIGKNWGKHIKRAVCNLVSGSKDYPDVTKDMWD